jgi:hypothetical protein
VFRSAFLVAAFLVTLNALSLLQGARFIRAAEGIIPLRVNPEVGVISVGSWRWLLIPLVVNAIFLFVNSVLFWRLRVREYRLIVMTISVVVSLFFLLGSVATMRAALLTL